MKHPFLVVLTCIALGCTARKSTTMNTTPALVPLPREITMKQGTFDLIRPWQLLIDGDAPGGADAGALLSDWYPRTQTSSTGPQVRLMRDFDCPAEGYRIQITDNTAVLSASRPAGMFYAVQTLLQLRDGDTLPACSIVDSPRFAWRGMMLDVARHFFNKEEVKRFIDLLAMHKMNRFHWHLVDDQGWRIEIRKYPKLVEAGAWRNDIGFGLNPKDSTAYRADGKYGGYYTRDDVREIGAYAKSKHITIVPEIELPGHSTAALNAYPELSCTGRGHDVNIGAGVHTGVYCAGNEQTFAFLEDVLSEVMELFPGEFIHIGGDEVPKTSWKACPKCRQRIADNKLNNEEELQSYFIKRIGRFIDSKGRRLIGWDEILEGGLAEGAAVMSWRGTAGGIEAANAGHDVVMSPTTHLYFDYLQERIGEPKGIGGFLPLEKVYSFEPISDQIAAGKRHHILGVQANLWTEYVPNFKHVEYMIFPRACALAEVTWSAKESRSYNDFLMRMEKHVQRLAAANVNYRPLPPVELNNSIEIHEGNPPTAKLIQRFPEGEIFYTLDGSPPAEGAARYTQPIPITQPTTHIRVRFVRPGTSTSFCDEAVVLMNGGALFESYAGTSDEKSPPANAFDGNDETAYALLNAVSAGSTVSMRFTSPRKVHRTRILTGSKQQPQQIFKNTVLEISEDGLNWKQVAPLVDGNLDTAIDAPPLKGIRIRWTREQFSWRTLLREWTVE